MTKPSQSELLGKLEMRVVRLDSYLVLLGRYAQSSEVEEINDLFHIINDLSNQSAKIHKIVNKLYKAVNS